MCAVSMVMDHYRDRWYPRVPEPFYPYVHPDPVKPVDWAEFAEKLKQFQRQVKPSEPAITDEEIREFRKLLERAREYDKRMNQPDCEMDDKRNVIKRIAAILGVDVSFVDEPTTSDEAATTQGCQ